MEFKCIKCGKEEAVLAETEDGLFCGDCNKENHREFLEEISYFTPITTLSGGTTVSG